MALPIWQGQAVYGNSAQLSDPNAPPQALEIKNRASYSKDAHGSPRAPNGAHLTSRSTARAVCCGPSLWSAAACGGVRLATLVCLIEASHRTACIYSLVQEARSQQAQYSQIVFAQERQIPAQFRRASLHQVCLQKLCSHKRQNEHCPQCLRPPEQQAPHGGAP